jgi:hypothetical protein
MSMSLSAETAATAEQPLAKSASFRSRLDAEVARGFRDYRRRLMWTWVANVHRFRERYADFLRHMVRHATSVSQVIQAAADSLQGEAREAFLHHLKEERGHERVAMADLKALGLSREWTPTPAAAALEGYSRDLARERPLAILGFLLMAEGLASRFGGRTMRVLQLLGVPQEATRFLRLHAEVDVAHFEELRTMCLDLAATSEDEESILEAVRVTAFLMGQS